MILLILCILLSSVLSSDHFTEEFSRAEKKTVTLALVGDGLVSKACKNFNLAAKLTNSSHAYNLEVSEFATSGAKIEQIKSKILKKALARETQAIILLWNSDVTEVHEDNMNSTTRAETRDKYYQNVVDVLDAIIATGAQPFLSGPTILGENKGMEGRPKKYINKDRMLEEYKKINEEIAKKKRVPYIDLRKELVNILRKRKHKDYKGFMTVDGEHFNEKGSTFVAHVLATAIKKWMVNICCV